MDVSPPCSSTLFRPSGVSGIPREVFHRLRVPPVLGSPGGSRFPLCVAGAGRAQGSRDGSWRAGRLVSVGRVSDFESSPGWVVRSCPGSSGETLGCVCNVIRAMS